MTTEQRILAELERDERMISWNEIDSRPLLYACTAQEIEKAVAHLHADEKIIVGQETDGRTKFSFSFIALNRAA